MFALKEYVAGLIFGWTWVELTMTNQPLLSGRRFFTERGALADWERSRDRRGLAPHKDRRALIRRPHLEAWLDGWCVGDTGYGGNPRPVLPPETFG